MATNYHRILTVVGLSVLLVFSEAQGGGWQEFVVSATVNQQEEPDIYGSTVVWDDMDLMLGTLLDIPPPLVIKVEPIYRFGEGWYLPVNPRTLCWTWPNHGVYS